MTTRVLGLCALLLALAAPTNAGTKLQMNIVAPVPDCYIGPFFCKNDGSACLNDSDCTASLSPASKFKIDGKTMLLKGGLKKVTDQAGTLITTNPADPNDDFILRVNICHCVLDSGAFDICSNCNTVYVRFDLKNGN